MIFKLTREEALELGLLVCRCGHPVNNHFTSNDACARCECARYREVARVGELLRSAPLKG